MAGLVLLGAGGHARVLLAALKSQGSAVMGCIAPEAPDGLWPREVPYLGGDDRLQALDRTEIELAVAVGSIGATARRKAVYEAAVASGFRVATVAHPTAFIDPAVTAGSGLQAMAGAVVQAGVHLGDNVLVNSGAVVDHDCRLGDHCHIAPGAVLSGGVSLGDGVHVGTGAVVIQGIKVGAGAVIGAGAVVLKDVEAGATVVGNPARAIKTGKQAEQP